MEGKKFLRLDDIAAYKRAFHLANYVWEIVIKWRAMAQRTVGEQYIEAIDSMSANIAEGFGRYGKKDKVKFYRYSFGSMYESLDWTEKARVRKLLTVEEYNKIFKELHELPREIHHLIKFTNDKLTF
ncbi:MAG TPA: four helix bundle protein [Patescibacteria group bacterium]|nr:four helix bundle protein [Patescibacteria group bacterium]